MLTTAVFREIVELDELIRSFTFVHNDTQHSYGRVCQTWLHACHDNMLMMLLRNQAEYLDHMTLTFPFMALPPPNEGRVFIGNFLGGVTLREKSDVIESAQAMLLIYSLSRETPELEEMSYKWEEEFIRQVGYSLLLGNQNYVTIIVTQKVTTTNVSLFQHYLITPTNIITICSVHV